MSSPIGALVAKVHPTMRRRIIIVQTLAEAGVTLFAPATTEWRRIELVLRELGILFRELDSVADDDDVKGDSISETTRAAMDWLKEQLTPLLGAEHAEALVDAAWEHGWARLSAWLVPHILKRVAEAVSN